MYGEPAQIPVTDDAPLDPVNSYGESKLMFERMLAWYATAHGLRHVSLRYFNACGAEEDGSHGECRRQESHLIPLALHVAAGKQAALDVYGTDWPTLDGTAIRDYVHVKDIAAAHIAAITGEPGLYVLGSGIGYSVRQVIDCAKSVTGKSIFTQNKPRREGDPTYLCAYPAKANKAFPGWHQHSLEDSLRSAWAWETSPNKYGNES